MPTTWRRPEAQSYDIMDETTATSGDYENDYSMDSVKSQKPLKSKSIQVSESGSSSSGIIDTLKVHCSKLMPKGLKISKKRIAQVAIALLGGHFLIKSHLVEQWVDVLSGLFGGRETYLPPKRLVFAYINNKITRSLTFPVCLKLIVYSCLNCPFSTGVLHQCP